MVNKNGLIGPEDYLEECVSCGKTENPDKMDPIPQKRIIERLDTYVGKADYEGAIRHLDYWMQEAVLCNDKRGELLVSNEFMGVYRKVGNKEKAIENATNALYLLPILEIEDTVTAGTTYVNAATVYDAFDEPELAINLFEKAQKIYEEQLFEDDEKLAGLYNNMALAKVAVKRFGEAYEYYQKALSVLEMRDDGQLEQAITYLNMANAVEDEHGLEKGEQKINQYLDLAEKLIEDENVERNGYYAFVCDKCAPTFEYYGYFITAAKLNKVSKQIYDSLQ